MIRQKPSPLLLRTKSKNLLIDMTQLKKSILMIWLATSVIQIATMVRREELSSKSHEVQREEELAL